MKFSNLADQARALFAGTVLLENYNRDGMTYNEENESNPGLDIWGEPVQVYAVELRTDYEANATEYEAAGVYYSEELGAYLWPVFSYNDWATVNPQNIWAIDNPRSI